MGKNGRNGVENAPEGFHLEYYENIIECTNKYNPYHVVKSLPTDECRAMVAEGQDQNEGFGKKHLTGLTVTVEEIKTALKYFIETGKVGYVLQRSAI